MATKINVIIVLMLPSYEGDRSRYSGLQRTPDRRRLVIGCMTTLMAMDSCARILVSVTTII